MEKSQKIEQLIRELLSELGENPNREGLKDTPSRVAKSLAFLTQGYAQNPTKIINGAKFTEKYSEIILVKDIGIYSLCEHHLLPFWGKAHVAYIPREKIIGLSKIARLVEMYARRLQVQERMTTQIASVLQEVLDPLGVAVIIEAEHLCMQMRGVQKRGSIAVTSAMFGVFQEKVATRQELMHLIKAR